MSAFSPQIAALGKLLRSGLFRRSAISTFDQALLSALNFGITIILIKHVSKAEYGFFSIAFSLALLVYSLECGLTLGPMWALLPGRPDADKARLTRGLFLGLVIVVACVGTLCFVFAAMIGMHFSSDGGLWTSIRFLGLAAIGIAIREFHRSLFFCQERPLYALRLDLAYATTYLTLVLIALASSKLNAAIVVSAMGIAALGTTLLYGHRSLWNLDISSTVNGYLEAWQFSKWALLGVIITHIQQYGYLYMLGSMLDSTAVAEASASRLLLMPVGLLLSSWGSISIPHGHRMRLNNQLRAYYFQQLVAAICVAGVIVTYSILLWAISEPLFKLLFTANYHISFRLFALWTISFIMDCFSSFAVLGMQVVKQFRILALNNAVTMLIASIGVYLLIRVYGVEGAIMGLSIGQLILAVSLWSLFWRYTALPQEIDAVPQ